METFPLRRYFLGTFPNTVAILNLPPYTNYAEWELSVISLIDRPLKSVVSHNVSLFREFTLCYILETTDFSGLLSFSASICWTGKHASDITSKQTGGKWM